MSMLHKKKYSYPCSSGCSLIAILYYWQSRVNSRILLILYTIIKLQKRGSLKSSSTSCKLQAGIVQVYYFFCVNRVFAAEDRRFKACRTNNYILQYHCCIHPTSAVVPKKGEYFFQKSVHTRQHQSVR